MKKEEPAASLSGRDRLSELPDCLLHSVLSSLRSRQVVQTCLLSRRWRHLWRSVPCLDVDQRDFLLVDPEPEAPDRSASDADWQVYRKAQKERGHREMKRQRSFEDFADAVLPLNGAWPLDAYRLFVAEEDLRKASYRWIRRGLARHPAELRVTYDFFTTFRSFEDDEVVFSFDFFSDGAGALPLTSRLRKLYLSGVILKEKFVEELRSHCPVLEELTLVKCDHYTGRIASPSLKRLHIEGLYRRYISDCSFGSLDSLDVPALVSLNLDKVCLPTSEVELQSLAVASITDPDSNYYQYRFLKSLRNARVLEFRSFTTRGLFEDEPQEFREFHNLRTLILKECDIGDGCQVLRYVLENVPNLERLVLQDCETSGRYKGESASSYDGTAFHGCKNLKSIQVKYKGQDVPHVLVVVLTQIAKEVIRPSKRNSVGWLDWMHRVVSCSHIVSLCEQYDYNSIIAELDKSLPDEEHDSHVWKHRAQKKHEKDVAIKARRRAAHPARR